MILTIAFAGRITGTRPCVDSVESGYTPSQHKRPVIVAFLMTDNSTGVSARERRHL